MESHPAVNLKSPLTRTQRRGYDFSVTCLTNIVMHVADGGHVLRHYAYNEQEPWWHSGSAGV
jgi:hypothetical protein